MTLLAELEANLGFVRADEVIPDTERPGLLRARTVSREPGIEEEWDVRSCVLRDDLHPDNPTLHLDEAGFEAVDISANVELQAALGHVRDDDGITDATEVAIRGALLGTVLPLANGRGLRIDFIADEGLINRRSGPNQRRINPGGPDGRNGHDAAPGIHADQDVYGVPLRKLMDGNAPNVFRHRTPDGRNDSSSTFLLNVWIPIRQITNPLVFMDRRTLDQARHQLRYGLPVSGFLDRDEDEVVNDIWKFLPDPAQEWYFRSEMGPTHCYVFDTLGTPHGAAVLPGEAELEELSTLLERASTAAAAGDHDRVAALSATPVAPLATVTTDPIAAAHRRMTSVLRAAQPTDAWIAEARAALESVVRSSVELRAVATLVD